MVTYVMTVPSCKNFPLLKAFVDCILAIPDTLCCIVSFSSGFVKLAAYLITYPNRPGPYRKMSMNLDNEAW